MIESMPNHTVIPRNFADFPGETKFSEYEMEQKCSRDSQTERLVENLNRKRRLRWDDVLAVEVEEGEVVGRNIILETQWCCYSWA